MSWVTRPAFWILLILATMVYGIATQRNLAEVMVAAAPVHAADPSLLVAPVSGAVVPVSLSPAPSFDVVRVAPSGSAVLAGRAAPGAEVTVRDGDALLGRSTADARGDWVLVPQAAIEPGGRAFSLAAREGHGPEIPAAESLVVIVPPRPSRAVPEPASVMAVVVPDQGLARVVQSRSAGLALQIVDYDANGEIRFAGSAPPGATLQLYIDNTLNNTLEADAAGRWSIEPARPVAAGLHMVRLDQINGLNVEARKEMPFQRDIVASGGTEPMRAKEHAGTTSTGPGQSSFGAGLEVMPVHASLPQATRQAQMVVQPGQNLWHLARMAYGEGTRYTLIFTANQNQIRDPNLIYPGQAFSIPTP